MSDGTQSELEINGSEQLTELLADVKSLTPQAKQQISQAASLKELEEAKVNWLGKKGKLSSLNQRMGKLEKDEKPIAGKMMNIHKGEIVNLLNKRKDELENAELEERLKSETLDITLPGDRPEAGSLHPVWAMTSRIIEIFRDFGFAVETGPEIETPWVNFDALNVPKEHPARDMQDTLYANRGYVLRTHTSPTQIRAMMKHDPPMAFITTGKVYRHDYDATHSPMFHQMEGLAITEEISFGHLKGLLHEFIRTLVGKEVKIRFRPSFFPFTEPSAEVDVWSEARKDWLEVLGSGMVHPNVLKNGGVDPQKYSGLAFGLGIDRLAMIYYDIPDLRLLFDNDLRFLRQF